MQEELVDIINEKGDIVTSNLKSAAHKEGLLHKVVIAEIVNSRGEFCFVKQAGDRQDAGQFVSPIGGHVTSGESAEQALIRESQEECGITPTKYRLIGTTILNREVIGRKENHMFLVYQIHSDRDPTLNHESTEFKWFSVKEIKQVLIHNPQTFGDAWHHVFRNIFPEIYKIT